MAEIVYDMPIGEAAKLLGKSDRQVRRYVKERQLKVNPVRVDGHMKLMFNRDDVLLFSKKFSADHSPEEGAQAEVIEGQVVEGDDGARQVEDMEAEIPPAVKYVVDALTSEIRELKKETKELHYQLEQRSGQVGFLQGKIEILQEEIKMLAPAKKEEAPKKSWFQRVFGGQG